MALGGGGGGCQNCRFATTRDLNNNKKQQVRCIVLPVTGCATNPSLSLLLMLSLLLFAFESWPGISTLKWNMKWLPQQAVTVRLIYECFVVCRSCYYSIYIVNLLMLLWTCVWLWTLSTPYLNPRAWILYLTRGNKDTVINWLIDKYIVPSVTGCACLSLNPGLPVTGRPMNSAQ